MRVGQLEFREVWTVDFEFYAPLGERPVPICLVARELASGRLVRLWGDELRQLRNAPYPAQSDCLVVAYYASAEMSCHLALDWPMPKNLLDLYVEFRRLTNGKPPVCGSGLLGALIHFGLDSIAATEKEEMRQLAMRGSPWSNDERAALLDYCQSDVDALARLLPRMQPYLDLPRALLRGRYMKSAARIEHVGVPIDVAMLEILKANWAAIRHHLIERIDADFGVFEGGTFKAERWARWLAAQGIPWPRLPSGRLALDDDTFREMARAYPAIAPIRELRFALSQLRLADLAIGHDGRNRCLLSAFSSKTGRNQPSNSKFIFGPSVWLRSLIQPQPGSGLAYIDWSQQEFGIAAALSHDEAMMEAYQSGDPYLTFAKQAGAAPASATKQSHGAVREQFKACVLAVQYGMEAESLACRIGRSPAEARELLRLHRQTYRRFWRWSDAALDYAMLHGWLYTAFGWTIHATGEPNPRSLRNFPMQANGAEMLRLACCLATESGIAVCAPVHDAILIEAPLNQLQKQVEQAQWNMEEASAVVLEGFRLRSEAKLIPHPERYQDERGQQMWETVCGVLRGPVPASNLSTHDDDVSQSIGTGYPSIHVSHE
jgi:DNA polymerase I